MVENTDIFSSIVESIGKTPQSVQSAFDYLKEFMQNANLFSLDLTIIVLSLLFFAMLIAGVKGMIWVVKNMRDNLNLAVKIIFSADGTILGKTIKTKAKKTLFSDNKKT